MPSPCIGICTLDPDGRLCLGCGRTLDEIARWTSAGPDEQSAIVAAAEARVRGISPLSRPSCSAP